MESVDKLQELTNMQKSVSFLIINTLIIINKKSINKKILFKVEKVIWCKTDRKKLLKIIRPEWMESYIHMFIFRKS